jgi:hypothetical protein
VISIEVNHKPQETCKKGSSAAISIMAADSSTLYGRQFDHSSGNLCSLLDRKSIDALKEHFRNDLAKDDWKLVMKLKKIYGVI